MDIIAMGNYVNSYIVMIGSAESIDNAERACKKHLNEHVCTQIFIERTNPYRISINCETINKAPESEVMMIKHGLELDAAFIMAIDYDGYEIAYFKEIDDKMSHDYEDAFNEIENKFEGEDDLFYEDEILGDRILNDFEKYIQNYIRK